MAEAKITKVNIDTLTTHKDSVFFEGEASLSEKAKGELDAGIAARNADASTHATTKKTADK